MWRFAPDINASYASVTSIMDLDAPFFGLAGPGLWNDADMLEVGKGMTTDEDTSHFSMWAMLASPLLAGNDIRSMTTTSEDLLTNAEVIAVDQDPLGNQGRLVATPQANLQIWSKLLSGPNTLAVGAAADRRPSWHLNHRLEYLLWLGLPTAILRQRTLVHRARLIALVGHEGAGPFTDAFPPPDMHSDHVEQLRTEGLGLLLEIQRLRHVQSEFAKLRNRLLVGSLLPGAAFVAIALWRADWFDRMTLAEVAALMGLPGGYLSVLMRAGALRWTPRYAANYHQVDRVFWNVLWNFCLSILEGSLGAIVLYLAFSSGIVTGGVFPTMPHPGPNHILRTADLTHDALTQLMLWSVAAGFSERAAPDFLSSLSKELSSPRASEEAARKGSEK